MQCTKKVNVKFFTLFFLAALVVSENHRKATMRNEKFKCCQKLILAFALEVVAITYLGDRERIKNRVADVLKDIEDWRYVAWAYDDMTNRKPSSLDDILKTRESKIPKKHSFAKKVSDYNQPTITPKKTKRQSHNHDR